MEFPRVSTIFHQHLRHIPMLSSANWQLIVDGWVTHPLTLTNSALKALPSQTTHAALLCAGHTPDHPMMADSQWTGVSLATLLAHAQPTAQATHLNIHSADGYATSIPLTTANQTLLAYQRDNQPLSAADGFPLRLITPGKLGYKLPKWIQHIIVSNQPIKGYWEQRGWNTTGDAFPIALIHRPLPTVATLNRAFTLEGHAYGGSASLDKVLISIDEAPPFTAQLTQSDHLSHWQATWTPSTLGQFSLRVWAVNTNGETQPPSTQLAMIIQVTV